MATEIKFYADEHIPRAVVRGLRDRGCDVLTAQEAGLLGASDPEHVRRAASAGRVIVTQDADFLRLHAEGMPHDGIAFAAQGTSVGKMIHALMLIRDILEPADMQGHVEFI